MIWSTTFLRSLYPSANDFPASLVRSTRTFPDRSIRPLIKIETPSRRLTRSVLSRILTWPWSSRRQTFPPNLIQNIKNPRRFYEHHRAHAFGIMPREQTQHFLRHRRVQMLPTKFMKIRHPHVRVVRILAGRHFSTCSMQSVASRHSLSFGFKFLASPMSENTTGLLFFVRPTICM